MTRSIRPRPAGHYDTKLTLVILPTARLNLRRLAASDLPAVAAMNADPAVMRYFPACLTREQSAEFLRCAEADFERFGFGFLAVEWRETREFAGIVGLNAPSFHAPFTPCVEAAWRVRQHFWRRGIATEGARAVIEWGFRERALDEIVAFTHHSNVASRGVMSKLGMRQDPNGNFEHPRLPVGHHLRPHVLYRLQREEFSMEGEQP